MFWVWRHGVGTWLHALLQTVVKNVNTTADIAKDFPSNEAQLWQAHDIENFKRQIAD